MSRKITQPVNQVRLTNVAVVRMNRHGKRFEVACYRNKILNYRQKIETDLSEVLQTDRVFLNVSKGLFASSKDLDLVFGTTDQEECCRIILDKGQIQVSDLERGATLENTAKEIANMVATKCVHPVSNRPYTTHQIRDAMKESNYSVKPTSARSVKQQFLDCFRAIQEANVLEIQRAKMELAFVFPMDYDYGGDDDDDDDATVLERLRLEANALIVVAGKDNNNDTPTKTNRIEFLVDPSQYRTVDAISKEIGVTLEIMRQTVTQEGDADVSSELERKTIRQSEHDASRKLQEEKNNHHNNVGALDDEDRVALALAGIALEEENDDEITAPDDYEVSNTRKKNKRAQKKSKKARRREKEEASLRQERIDAEKTRREEREFRLSSNKTKVCEVAGTSSGVKAGDGDGGNNGGAMKSCNTCGGSFTPSQYRAHFRSEWHRYNIKLKMKGVKPVEEKEFLMIDADAFFDM